MEQRTDEQLLAAYLDGDAGAFRTLIERHQDVLLRFLLRFTGSRQLAEDVFQETFLQVHLSGDTFDTSRRFRPWLFTIAANKARDHMRRAGRRSMLDLSAPLAGGDGKTYLDLMEVDVDAPDARLDDMERDQLVQKALNELPDHLREILLMAYFQKLSYQAIADELEIPLGTVKSRLHAAVAAFGKRWAGYAEAERAKNPSADRTRGGRAV